VIGAILDKVEDHVLDTKGSDDLFGEDKKENLRKFMKTLRPDVEHRQSNLLQN